MRAGRPTGRIWTACPYSPIYQLMSYWTDIPFMKDVLALQIDEKSFYEARLASLKKEWQNCFLAEGEQDFWLKN